MEKTVVIVNPIAGNGKSMELWPEVRAYLSSLGLDFEERLTQRQGHAIELAREAVEAGARAVVAVGGDGTLHEVVNGVGVNSQVAIGLIPTGSGNDFLRSLGLQPGDWQQACRVIAAGCTALIDLGEVNGRKFINVAGAGLDAAVVDCANTWGKRVFGNKLGYIAALLRTLVQFQPAEATLHLDDQVVESKIWLIAVANGRFFGGGMRIAPDAAYDDGLFDICVVGRCSKLSFLTAFPRIYNGSHLAHPAVSMYRAARVEVKTARPVPIQTDGEVVATTPEKFRMYTGVLRVFVNQETRGA
jgi:diacylglycerol kinase (ATP)